MNKNVLVALLTLSVAGGNAAALSNINTGTGKGSRASTVTVAFEITTATQVHVRAEKGATAANIKPGDIVMVAYHRNGNVFVADRIGDVGNEPPQRHASAKQEHPKRSAARSNELHAVGIVQSIDPQSGTLVLTEGHHRKA